jgi:hypothetical protein
MSAKIIPLPPRPEAKIVRIPIAVFLAALQRQQKDEADAR